MRRNAIILAVMFFCTAASSATEAHRAHDFHYSRFALEWNATSATWQGILRVFTDDLENALNRVNNSTVAWRLGDEREDEDADGHIAAYASNGWTLIDSSGQAMEWTFVGKEVDFDITYIYLETAPTTAHGVRHVESHGFSELFEDQVNEISLTLFDRSLRLWLNEEDPVKPVEFRTDE